MSLRKTMVILLALFVVMFSMGCGGSGGSDDDDTGTPAGGNGGGVASIPNYLCFIAAGASTVKMGVNGTVTPLPELEYSKDGLTWTAFEFGSTTVDLADGEKVYLCGDNTSFSAGTSSNFFYFIMTGSIAASGNVMSLLDKTCASTAIPSVNCFSKLFVGCTVLTSAPPLPATTLAKECYAAMFSGCTKLTSLRVHFNAWTPADATSGWVKDVSATGKFYYKSPLDVSVKDDDHVPANFAPEIF